jgi:uncharacterized protein YkwD
MFSPRLTITTAALLSAAALALPVGAGAATSACANADVVPSASNVTAVRTAVLCLLNAQRTGHGLGALHSNASLAHAAGHYSQTMVREGFFDHVSPGGSTLSSRINATKYLSRGVRSWALGENIGWASGTDATPAQMVSAWMHSAGHRANILDSTYRDIGVGVALGAPTKASSASTAATFTTDFGEAVR